MSNEFQSHEHASTHAPASERTFSGQALRATRKGAGWSLRQFAQAAGLSASHLSKLERGACVPSTVTLMRIARAFEVEAAWVYENLFMEQMEQVQEEVQE